MKYCNEKRFKSQDSNFKPQVYNPFWNLELGICLRECISRQGILALTNTEINTAFI
jgi:hypothetical protein